MLTATHSRASSPSRAIAEHIAQIDRGQIPQAALYGAKQSILDTVGVMIAATGLVPAAADLSALICELGGRPTSTVLGFGYQTSPPSAAFVNGGMAHCLDYDDFHAVGFHPSAPTVPAGLAVAESRSLSGADLLTAVAIGNDVGIRLCQAAPNALECGWYTTPMLGNISAAAVAARLLSLDTAGVESALSLSSIQAGGTLQMRLGSGTAVAGFCDAWPAHAGVLAALLAEGGVNGIQSFLEGPMGVFPTYFGSGCTPDAVVEDLGERFHGADVRFKPWPSCSLTHGAIDASLELSRRHGFRPDDISRVVVSYGRSEFSVVCDPADLKRKPKTAMDARFSIQYTTAVALTRQRVTLADFDTHSLTDSTILDVASRVETKHDPSLGTGTGPAVVEVTLADGRSLIARTTLPYGQDPDRPVSERALVEKFYDCIEHAAIPLSDDAAKRSLEMLLNLEAVRDVRELMTNLVTPAS